MRVYVLILFLCLTAGSVVGQADDSTRVTADTTIFIPDSNIVSAALVADTTNLEENLIQQPTIALFKSMVVPGWGQFGNRKYVKAALFAGLQTWLVVNAVDRAGQASDARDDWNASTDITERNRLYDIYESKRDQRNKYIWFAGITAFVSMFDAFVDAHLSGAPGRNESRSVGFEVVPDGDDGARAVLSLSF